MIVDLKTLKKILKSLRKENKKIVFTNGCFDLIHAGHIELLKKAKKKGDVLIVGLNSDSSIKKIKGDKRPIVNEKDRAKILDSIKYVDYVIFFNEKTPYRLIKEIKPDVLVKGADYKIDEVVGGDIVLKRGGEVFLVPLVKGKSTSNLIKKILSLYARD
ncbi:MAG: D-glycero-beta-D-manno-heptose 1-phosphate adenylyltransferase [Candidatus Hydrothermales bacterium]